jgi:hypothetical protein
MALLNLYLTLDNWHTLRTENRYYPKAAIFCPMGLVFFGAATVFPGLISNWLSPGKKLKPGPMHYLVVIVSFATGLLNWYAMTH